MSPDGQSDAIKSQKVSDISKSALLGGREEAQPTTQDSLCLGAHLAITEPSRLGSQLVKGPFGLGIPISAALLGDLRLLLSWRLPHLFRLILVLDFSS